MVGDVIVDGTVNGTDPCCTPSGDVGLDAMAADLQVLTAMGNDTRYELLRRIANADDGVRVCELEATVSVSQSAVSQALSRLYAAQLVTRRTEGAWRYYEATETASTLLETLDDLRDSHD